MMNRKAIAIIMAASLCLMTTGCGNTQTTTQSSTTAATTESGKEAATTSTESQSTAGTQTTTGSSASTNIEGTVINLNDTTATIDGVEVEEFDYVWKISPDQEKEWYEGTEPNTDAAVYIAHDIIYYPELDVEGFTKTTYDGEQEWVYHYTAEGLTDYIFSTLPAHGDEVPTQMMHTEEEAYANKVLHITQPGTYILEGEWHGQILVDLGDEDEVFTDETAKVTLVLNGVDITCDVAPGVLFESVYECDNAWEEAETHSGDVDTSDAGANVYICDGTVNNVTGANVYRLLKAKYKNDSTTVQKKAHKIDGAFYSCMSLNIDGGATGILNITSTTFEGLDSELHLTINGGFINIYSQDDAMNVNEDDVSVFTMNGGTLHIFAGLGDEGDGIDSNGYITVNGGIIAGGTPSGTDELLDSNCGNTINGGQVIRIGSEGFSAFNFGGGGPNFGGGQPNFGDGQAPNFGDGQAPNFGDGQAPNFGNGQQPPEGFTPPTNN